MIDFPIKIIGVMSGTSLDGIDLAFCTFWIEDTYWKYELKACSSINYPDDLKNQLAKAFRMSAEELTTLDIKLGSYFGTQINLFINSENIKPDYISSHGHTIFHQPENGFSLQIANGQLISAMTELPVICDFRSLDVMLGGQGAPFVPIGDQMLFNEFDFCLNLGGISNISFDRSGKRIAFDIGPANMLLNYLAKKINHDYDDKGNIAATGKMILQLLEDLNGLEYYQRSIPKSLGYEWFVVHIFPLVEKYSATCQISDLLHTACHHIAMQICDHINRHSTISKGKILITGGGVFNDFLMSQIKFYLPSEIKIAKSDDKLIAFKEAIVFAFMGVLRLNNQVNVLSSVTGASRDSCSGVIYHNGRA